MADELPSFAHFQVRPIPAEEPPRAEAGPLPEQIELPPVPTLPPLSEPIRSLARELTREPSEESALAAVPPLLAAIPLPLPRRDTSQTDEPSERVTLPSRQELPPTPNPRLVPHPAPRPNADVDHDLSEREVLWISYAGWALLPSFLVCLSVTGLVLIGSWYLDWVREGYDRLGWKGAALLLAALWLFQLTRWGYRVTAYNYRLTDRHLYVSLGPLYERLAPVPLNGIARVTVHRTPLERLLGIGRIRLVMNDDVPSLILEGVSRPGRLAAILKKSSGLND